MKREPVETFIESWGTMGALWGINRSMARIQALLIVSEEPLHLDQIAETLSISRGNASMSLKELRNWGVIHRVHVAGDRRDYFVPESDMWTMFFRIGKERKRREFDPVLSSLRALLAKENAVQGARSRARLVQAEAIASTVNRMAEIALADEGKARNIFGFFTEFLLKDK